MTRDKAQLAGTMNRILQCVRQRTGLYFRSTQLTRTTAAVSRAMQRARETEPIHYAARLEQDLETLDDLIVELVVGETYFFRIPEQFDFIRETISRQFQAHATNLHSLRVWSAGCATGEEPYSLAILFQEMGILDRTHILATDISRPALERARRGHYRNWSFRGTEAERAKGHCTLVGDGLALRADLIHVVHFAYLNLALDVYPSLVSGTRDLDLILCRNVLIYFDRDTVRRVARRLYDALTPGGWLVTAASDPPLEELAPFEAVTARGGVYYRRPTVVDAAWRRDPGRGNPEVDFLNREVNRPNDSRSGVNASMDSDRSAPSLNTIQGCLLSGDYERVIAMTESRLDEPSYCVLHVKALANDDATQAERVCRGLVAQHPLSVELHYLHAVLLMERHQNDDALSAIRKTLYLDRSVAIAHFILGTLARRMGDAELACRAFRNAREACLGHSANAVVRFAEDETYESLTRAVEFQLASIVETIGDVS